MPFSSHCNGAIRSDLIPLGIVFFIDRWQTRISLSYGTVGDNADVTLKHLSQYPDGSVGVVYWKTSIAKANGKCVAIQASNGLKRVWWHDLSSCE
jgi:hypothetical protein